MKVKVAVAVVVFLGMVGVASQGFAAGFAIIEQSVKGLGNAFAGASASAEDAATIYFNPAGLTRLSGQQAVTGLHYVLPQAEFSDDGSTVSPALTGGASVPLAGGDGGDAGEGGLIPNLYYAANLNNGWAAGLGVNAPFALATEYDDDWKGRYHAIRSEVQTVNINPSLAYQVTDRLSLGAGVSAQYLDAELTNAIDFGAIALAQSGGLAGVPQAADGKVRLEADDWTWGFNVGLLYQLSEGTRLGAAYRSGIKHTAEGDADFSVPDTITGDPTIDGGLAAMFADTDAQADVDLPATASLSLYHEFTPALAILADVTWTEWSSFEELRVEFDRNSNGLTMTDNVTTFEWDDSWRYSLGATYDANERLALRAGVAFDETPIPNAERRNPRVPGEDRFWTTIGLGYRFTENLSADAAYAHLFVSDSKIDKDPTEEENIFRGALKGEFENSVDIASVQVSYRF